MTKSVSRLIAGFRRFKEKYFLPEDSETSVYQRLATSGQTPRTLIIGCSDSRVDPAILTDAQPGELFVVRNVANLVPPCEPSAVGFHGTSSAIEFAVKNLNVENIIVLGHRQCGGIRALMSHDTERSQTFVGQWVSIAEEARQKVLTQFPKASDEMHWRLAETESIKVSLKNLRTFPFVREAEDAGLLKVYGVFFDLELGQLWQYQDASGQFERVDV